MLGSKRNYLIVKDDVGRSKPTTRDLPNLTFTYGKPDQIDKQESAALVCSSWVQHEGKASDDSNNPRNFMKLNKKAVISGSVTAKDNYVFRQTNDARIPFGLSALKKTGRDISLPN